VRVISIRIAVSPTSASAAAPTARSAPTTPTTASAAAALCTMCRPLTPNRTATSPHGVVSLNDARARSSSTTSVMRTSASAASPYVTTVASVRERIAATRGSSALSTAVPDEGSACTSSAFARATPSMPPTRSLCASATRVTTPMVGRAMSHSSRISPKPRMPISNTITSVSAGALSNVVGRPCSLLKLRSFAHVRRLAPSAAHARSLVDVLPTDPVMPTSGPEYRCR